MQSTLSFGEILEAAHQLSLEEQESLVEILRRRMVEKRRAELLKDIESARAEFTAGQSSPITPDDLMAEILS
jgi:hypothetical protein